MNNDAMFEKLKNRGAYYNYFFSNLSSEKPLAKLNELGFFDESTPAIRKDGYISYPRWAPVEYLIKAAATKPKEVMDIILAVKQNDNQAVHGQFIEASLNMPASEARRLVPSITIWLRDPNLHLLPYRASELVKLLAEGGEIDSSIALSKELLIVKPPQTESDKVFGHPQSRIGTHELNEFLKKEFTSVLESSPQTGIKLLINSLRAALKLKEREDVEKDGVIEDYSEIWLADFDKESNRSDPETVLAIRMYKWLKGLDDAAVKKASIKLLFNEKYKLFRRIAVALIGENNPDDELKRIYNLFVKKSGNPIVDSGITSWTGPLSPLSDEEFNGKTSDELIDYMNNWVPTVQIMSPSVDGLGYQINRKVTENPKFGVGLIASSKEIKQDYLDHIYSGLDQAARNKKDMDWSVIFSAIEKILSKLEANLEKSDYNLILALTRLIESGANSDMIDLKDGGNRSTVLRLIQLGLKCNDPDIAKKEKPFDKSASPDIGGINTNRGVALFCLVHVMKRATRQNTNNAKPLSLFSLKERKLIEELLSNHVLIQKEPSFAVRTAYAHELPYIWSALKDWTSNNLDNIFPTKNEDYFRVNVETFIMYSQVYFPIVDTMRPILVEYMSKVRSGKFQDVSNEDLEHLTGKIMIYYLNGKIKVDDELMKYLFSLSDEWTGQAIEFIGRNLKELTSDKDKQINRRAIELWDGRKPNATDKENSYFGMWFICDGMDYEWRKSNFMDALKATNSVEALWQVFDWLQSNVEKYPEDVVTIFEEIVRTQTDQILHFTLTRDVEAVIEKLAQMDTRVSKDKLKSLVDRLLSRNVGDYRKILK